MSQITKYSLALFGGALIGFTAANMYDKKSHEPKEQSEWQQLKQEIAKIRQYQLDNNQVVMGDTNGIKMQLIREELEKLLAVQESKLQNVIQGQLKDGFDSLEINLRRDMQITSSNQEIGVVKTPSSPLNQDISKDPNPQQIAAYESLQKLLEHDSIRHNFEMTNITGSKEFAELHPIQRDQLMSEIYTKINKGELVMQGHSH